MVSYYFLWLFIMIAKFAFCYTRQNFVWALSCIAVDLLAIAIHIGLVCRDPGRVIND